MLRVSVFLLAGAAATSGCALGAGANASTASAATPAAGASDAAAGQSVAPPPRPPLRNPDIVLSDSGTADVRGQRVTFDGVIEGLAWPSLDKALRARTSSDVVAIRVARNVTVLDVLRAAWTVRANDVEVQTPDESGRLEAASLGARASRNSGPGCHVAVFLRPDGSLRVATPGGPREVAGDRASDQLARSLAAENARCPIKYVAFGAESDQAPWGLVFDVLATVDRAKSAGSARYVLAQAMH
jgi:hypothetical protein